MTLRLSLLVSEFRKFAGSVLCVNVGEVVPFEALRHSGDRKLLTEELHAMVHALAGPEAKPRKLSKVRGVSRLARQKVRKVRRLATQKARGVGRLARRKLRLRRDRGGTPAQPGL